MSSNDPTTGQTGQDVVVLDPAALKALDKLNDDQKRQARALAHNLDVNDTNAILGFGADAQRTVNNALTPVLQQVRVQDSGATGQLLTDLLHQTRALDPHSLLDGPSGLAGIPVLGKLFDKIQRFKERFDTVEKRVEQIVAELEKQQRVMGRDIRTLDVAFTENRKYRDALLVVIAAGEIKLQQLHEDLDKAVAKANATNDPYDAQAATDLNSLIDRLEKRLYDLKLGAVISLQTGPQIRLVQAADQALMEKIQTSLLNTIPLWKQQIIVALALFNQKKALGLQQAVTDTTNKLLQTNADMLHEGVTSVARETQRGIVEIETLVHTHEQLVSTIEDALRIQEEGRQKRIANEQELDKLSGDLGKQLAQLQAPKQ
jgi:uncharacterized protein YaaN involved in tellurite resistance